MAALTVAEVLAVAVGYVLEQDVPGHGGELPGIVGFRSGRMSVWETLGQSVLSVTVVGGRMASGAAVGAWSITLL